MHVKQTLRFPCDAAEVTKNCRNTTGALCLLVAILLLSSRPTTAEPITGDPTFLLPNSAVNTPYTFPSARTVANGYSLNCFYFDSGGNQVWQRTGAVFSNTPGSLYWGKDTENYSELYAALGSFDTKAYHKARTDGSVNNYTYGSSQVWNWFVMAGGTPGETVTLAADILVQGKAFAQHGDGGNAGTIFGVSLGFLSSPLDLIQDHVTSLGGAVNWSEFSTNNTIDEDVVWDSGAEVHEINWIIRSQPFTVTVGTPFRLSLITAVQGFAGPGNWGEAWSDFFDPRIVTSSDSPNIPELTPDGFVVLKDHVYSSLAEAGYSMATIPEPSSVAVFLGLGCCFVGARLFSRARRR